jgi:hypothetical protein
VIVCAHNEARLLPACLHSLRAQTRPPDDILVINNASTDETGAVARGVPGVRVVDEPAKGLVEEILKDIRRQEALSIACHPHHRTTRRIEIGTCYLWDHRKRLAELVDVWEAANRDDLFSVTSLKHYPYVASSDFHKPKHLYSWKTLLRCDKNWEAIARTLRANVDVALTLYRNGSWAA